MTEKKEQEKKRSSFFKIFKHQHWTAAFFILFMVVFYMSFLVPLFSQGSFYIFNTSQWAILNILVITFHHVFVLLSWRFELHKGTYSKLFSKHAFKVYEIGFFIPFFSRIILLVPLAISNLNTSPIPPLISYVIALVFAIPMLYTFYSVGRYFGMARAAGADHFLPEYREKPFVKQGIYKYTGNAMYKFAMLVVFMPGLLLGSVTALLIGVFNYLYVWVHYYTLERPDFEILYANS